MLFPINPSDQTKYENNSQAYVYSSERIAWEKTIASAPVYPDYIQTYPYDTDFLENMAINSLERLL